MIETPAHTDTAPVGPEIVPTSKPLVILGVTGSIAAYKACEVARELIKSGCRVRVILTAHGAQFVGAPTFHALTGEPVEMELFSTAPNATNHIDLAKSADLMLVVPATANIVAKLAWGVADDLLSTVAVATNAPLLIAPAMNPDMWGDPTVRANLATLEARGVDIVEPATGEVVCGDTGQGKLAEVAVIVDEALQVLARKRDLVGVRAVVTAGPTREPIDPVRFIGNRSSGKMGYALARELVDRGAEVTLISGPVTLAPPADADVVQVETANQMRAEVAAAVADADLLIAAAAVADFRVESPAAHKVHRGSEGDPIGLTLVPNPDILAEVGQKRASGELASALVIVGFAAEDSADGPMTLEERGRAKLARKMVDLIVVNDISNRAIGFDADHNEVTVVSAAGSHVIDRATKRDIARAIIDDIRGLISPR